MESKDTFKGKLEVMSAMELIEKTRNEPERKFLWDGIPQESIGLISGVGKTGKTTFAENLGISFAVGRKEYYGSKMDGIPRKVLFINLEESRRLKCLRNIKQITRLNDDELDLFAKNYFSTPETFPQYLNTDNDWEEVREYIKASEAEIIFIDSLGHMCIGEIEKSAVAQSFMQKFKTYIGALNKTVIVVHHMVKGNEKPITQDNIAGSRFILQEFEYAYGFAHIPTAKGGSYSCMLYNKHIPKDDNTATLYRMFNDGWIENIGTDNKFNLYKTNNNDGRRDQSNKTKLYNYFVSQGSQGSQNISSDTLIKEFVETGTMSKDTMYNKVKLLEKDGVIQRETIGNYKILIEKGHDSRV